MAYGLYIELIGKSQIFKKKWKVRVSCLDYTGSVTYRNVPAESPFVLRKDSAGTIRGTSFEYAIRSLVDFEFISLFTSDVKKYKVDLLDASDNLIWSGFNLPEQYSEAYVPAPCVVRFTASDQLGLLKDIEYTQASGIKTELEILNECLDNCGLDLGYAVSIGIRESRQTANRSVLSEIKKDASVYSGESCYDVIVKILSKYNASITQAGTRWLIADSSKTATLIYYTSAGAFESVGSVFQTLKLGKYDDPTSDLYVTGSAMELNLAASYKKITLSQDYGIKSDMLPGSKPEDWTSGNTLPGWSTFGSVNFYHDVRDDYDCIYLGGAIRYNVFTNGIKATLQNIETTTEELSFNFDFSLGFTASGSPPAINLQVKVYATDGVNTQYLGSTGWSSSSSNNFLLRSIPKTGADGVPVWGAFRSRFTGIPLSGTMYVEISFPVWNTSFADTPASFYVKNVAMMQYISGAAIPAGENNSTILNSSTSASIAEIEVVGGDVPNIANAKHLFRNYATLLNGTLTGQWVTDDLTSDTLVNVLKKIYASDNRFAKQILRGRIRGSDISFDRIVTRAYPALTKFEFVEFSYDLIADAVDVTLAEILDFELVDFTTVIETINADKTTSSSSSGSGSSGGTAATTTTDTTNFNKILGTTESDVQKALDKLDDHSHPEYLISITKAMVEAVLTGDITSHSHSQYLISITKAMVEAVLTGTISSHDHTITKTMVEAALTGAISSHYHTLTKAAVEAVLTGDITSHSHSQYLISITKAMVEAVLTGDITSHSHSSFGNSIALKNPSGVVKWYMSVDSGDNLVFTSVSGFGFSVSQSGNMSVSKEVSAYS